MARARLRREVEVENSEARGRRIDFPDTQPAQYFFNPHTDSLRLARSFLHQLLAKPRPPHAFVLACALFILC